MGVPKIPWSRSLWSQKVPYQCRTTAIRSVGVSRRSDWLATMNSGSVGSMASRFTARSFASLLTFNLRRLIALVSTSSQIARSLLAPVQSLRGAGFLSCWPLTYPSDGAMNSLLLNYAAFVVSLRRAAIVQYKFWGWRIARVRADRSGKACTAAMMLPYSIQFLNRFLLLFSPFRFGFSKTSEVEQS